MKNYKSLFSYVVLIFVLLIGCSKDDPDPVDNEPTGTVTDIDGNIYHTVKIGEQVWMIENLRVTHYNDGTEIPNITDFNEWKVYQNGAYCWYDNNSSNGEIYGILYNWNAVNTNKLCPQGWHVPSKDNWQQLIDYLESEGFDPIMTAGRALKANDRWDNQGGGTNDYGFTAYPNGYRLSLEGGYSNAPGFIGRGTYGTWWTSTGEAGHSGRYIWMTKSTGEIRFLGDEVNRGMSVRCIKD